VLGIVLLEEAERKLELLRLLSVLIGASGGGARCGCCVVRRGLLREGMMLAGGARLVMRGLLLLLLLVVNVSGGELLRFVTAAGLPPVPETTAARAWTIFAVTGLLEWSRQKLSYVRSMLLLGVEEQVVEPPDASCCFGTSAVETAPLVTSLPLPFTLLLLTLTACRKPDGLVIPNSKSALDRDVV
jgi:hypothetical protein